TSTPTSLSTIVPESTTQMDSQFSFLSQTSSLVVASTSTLTPSDTLTDPDAPTSTTIVPIPVGTSQAATPKVPQIPSNLPTRIFSPNSVNATSDASELTDKTLISLLFQSQLNWLFINSSSQSVGQIFAFMPQVLMTALSINDSDVLTYALQVQIPQGWSGDLTALGTMYLAYIPSDQINQLSALLRATNSKFYNQSGIAGQLANLVVPSFSLVSVTPGSASTTGSGSGSSASSSGSKTRTDAIIGVCAAVGGIAALVGIWWVVRYIQRKQAAKHRRLSNLSDPNMSNGVYGTQHDDRRTSFFYAEDELRGGYVQQAPTSFTQPTVRQAAEGSMQQRIVPQHAPISAPVLQQNSLNW
ncbi:hypothetical protein K439DRAFT_1345301, partial [Ramaria rubella]